MTLSTLSKTLVTAPTRTVSTVDLSTATVDLSSAPQLQTTTQQVEDLSTLAVQALDTISIVRDSFVNDSAPIQTVGSGSTSAFIEQFGSAAPHLIAPTARFGLDLSKSGAKSTPPSPRLDSVKPDIDRGKGTLDAFIVKLRASLKSDELDRVDRLFVYRAFVGKSKLAQPPKFSAATNLISTATRKNVDQYAVSLLRSDGVMNELLDVVKDDVFSPLRATIEQVDSEPIVSTRQSNRADDFSGGLIQVDGLDRSVLSDATTAINVRTTSLAAQSTSPVVVGSLTGLNVLRGGGLSTELTVVEGNNSLNAKKIATLSASRSNRRVGDFLEYDFVDSTVSYGNVYAYYVVSVAADGTMSVRSRVLTLDVTFPITPVAPDVSYDVVASQVRFNIRHPASNIDSYEIYRRVSGDSSVHLADVKSSHGGASFVDRSAPRIVPIEYRIFAVDAFGLKSQVPFDCVVEVPEYGSLRKPRAPIITAEQDVGGRAVKISVAVDDRSIRRIIVDRQDRTIGQQDFVPPNVPASCQFGLRSKSVNSRSGPRIVTDRKWVGVLEPVSGFASMVDRDVAWDRAYRYRVRGIDAHGHESDYTFSTNVFVASKRVIDPPHSLSLRRLGQDVELSWEPGIVDIPPRDLIGDQDVLAATAQRVLFQVERRQVLSTSGWRALNPTTGTNVVDVGLSPGAYEYRVLAMQSGGFISTYSDVASIATVAPPSPISAIWARSPDGVEPTVVVVSWDQAEGSPDGWEIERACVNRLYGSRIVSVDSEMAANLPYTSVGKVSRESSRGFSREADASMSSGVDRLVYVGSRWFVDSDIDRANMYFYRIRAFSIGGASTWTRVGFKFVDPLYVAKLSSVITPTQLSSLAVSPTPITTTFGKIR